MTRVPLALLICVAPIACTQSPPKPADVPYRDQRSVTTRPAPTNGRAADVLVRVQELQAAPLGTLPPPGDVPADAKVLASIETVATFGTPFYCTLALPERRIELGGVIVRNDGPA
jgi:hypothetical protein